MNNQCNANAQVMNAYEMQAKPNAHDTRGQHANNATILTCHHHDQCGISKTSENIRL